MTLRPCRRALSPSPVAASATEHRLPQSKSWDLRPTLQFGIASRFKPGKGIHVVRKQEGLGPQVKNGHGWNEFAIFGTSAGPWNRALGYSHYSRLAGLRLAPSAHNVARALPQLHSRTGGWRQSVRVSNGRAQAPGL